MAPETKRILVLLCAVIGIGVVGYVSAISFMKIIVDKHIRAKDPHEVVLVYKVDVLERAFFKLGVNPNSLNNRGENVLFSAVRRNDAEIVRLILGTNVDVLLRNQEGETAMDVANRLGASEDIIEQLKSVLTQGLPGKMKGPTKR